MKTNRSNNRSLKQNSNRLVAYLAASLGASTIATSTVEAAIVGIDIGPTGFNIGGINAGLNSGFFLTGSNFPLNGGGSILLSNNKFGITGIGGVNGLNFAMNSSYYASPRNFALNASIDSSANFNSNPPYSAFKYTGGTTFTSPNFNSGSYMGFKTLNGRYGWMEVTWTSAVNQFQIFSAAYEDVIGLGIAAGDTGGGTSAVPEPGQVASSLLLLALGSAGVAIQRRRAKKKLAVAGAQS